MSVTAVSYTHLFLSLYLQEERSAVLGNKVGITRNGIIHQNGYLEQVHALHIIHSCLFRCLHLCYHDIYFSLR